MIQYVSNDCFRTKWCNLLYIMLLNLLRVMRLWQLAFIFKICNNDRPPFHWICNKNHDSQDSTLTTCFVDKNLESLNQHVYFSFYRVQTLNQIIKLELISLSLRRDNGGSYPILFLCWKASDLAEQVWWTILKYTKTLCLCQRNWTNLGISILHLLLIKQIW